MSIPKRNQLGKVCDVEIILPTKKRLKKLDKIFRKVTMLLIDKNNLITDLNGNNYDLKPIPK